MSSQAAVIYMAGVVATNTIWKVVTQVKAMRDRAEPMTAWEVSMLGGAINIQQAVGGEGLKSAWRHAWRVGFQACHYCHPS